jgi:hypothetical protein
MSRLSFFHLISINHEVENESDYFVKPEILITIQIEIKKLKFSHYRHSLQFVYSLNYVRFKLNFIGHFVNKKQWQIIIGLYHCDELSMQRIVRRRIVLQRIVHATNCPCDELSGDELSCNELSMRRIVRNELSATNCPATNCPVTFHCMCMPSSHEICAEVDLEIWKRNVIIDDSSLKKQIFNLPFWNKLEGSLNFSSISDKRRF